MKLSELAPKPPKIILWGPLGTGKTALALTLGARAQVIDIGEDGLLTGMTLQDAWTEHRRAVDVVQFLNKEPHKKADAFQRCKDHVFKVANECHKGVYPFQALIVDSLSELARLAVQQILYNSGRPGQNPEIQHWGLAFTEILSVIDCLRNLPIPVILIGHDQLYSVGEGKDKEDRIELAVSGKNMPTQIPRGFDEVWYMRVKPAGAGVNKYLLQTKTSNYVLCRSRGNLPDMTDSSCGMWELLARLGYKPKEVQQTKT